jgi:hypothetical protein
MSEIVREHDNGVKRASILLTMGPGTTIGTVEWIRAVCWYRNQAEDELWMDGLFPSQLYRQLRVEEDSPARSASQLRDDLG